MWSRDVVAARPDPRPLSGAPSAAPLFPVGLVVAALVESIWLLFLGWMAVGGG